MNDKLQEQLAEMLTALQRAVERGADAANSQLTPLIHEYLMWGMAVHICRAIIFVLLTLAFAIAGRKVWNFYITEMQEIEKGSREGHSTYRIHSDMVNYTIGKWLLGMLAPLVACSVFSSLAVSNVFTVVQIWVAPRVYLISKVAELVRPAAGN